MENVEKVVKELEALDRSMSLHQCYACSYEFIEVVNEFGTNIIPKAIDLLKEQEPIKPIEREGFYYCGACRDAFTRPRQKFCSDCGKPVKWE